MPTGPKSPALPRPAGTANRQQLLPFMLEPAPAAAESPRLPTDADGCDSEPATGS